jgi:citrate lyase subunit beta/citryl-CoA lyase
MIYKDLEAAICPPLTGISLPKVESAAEIYETDKMVAELETRRGLEPGSMQFAVAVETPKGVLNAYEIARASRRIVTLTAGDEDLTSEMDIETTKEGHELAYVRSWIILVANAADIQPMGLVGADRFSWKEPESAYLAAVRSRKLGFKGSTCIHPALVPHLNRGFSPSPEEVDWAQRAIQAFEEGLKKGTASVALDERMVDMATVRRCKDLLARHKTIRDFEEKKDSILRKNREM